MLEQTGPEKAFLEHLEAQILKKYFAKLQPCWRLCGFNACTSLPKKALDMSLLLLKKFSIILNEVSDIRNDLIFYINPSCQTLSKGFRNV